MPRSFIPRTESKRATWLHAYAAALDENKGQAGITAADVAQVQADAEFYSYLLTRKAEMRQASENITAYTSAMADGQPEGANPNAPTTLPVMPAAGTPPAPVPWDIFGRAGKMAARIKLADGYTPALGRALGIVAEVPEERPVQDMQPDLKFIGLNAGHPMFRWVRGDAEMTELQADRGDGKGWVQVTKTMRSELTDPFPLPAPGVAQVWRYRAIFHSATAPIGQWSDVVQVTITGA